MKIIVSSALAVAALAATQTQAAYPADVQAMLDTSVDPCDDFFQYTCGGWFKSYTLPANRTQYSYSFNGISDRNDIVIQNILKEDWPLIGELYDSCLATDSLNALGNKPLQKDLGRIVAAQSKKDLARIAGDIGSFGPSLFTGIGVGADDRDAKNNGLYAGSAGHVLSRATYYTRFEAPFRKYVTTLVTLAGINLSGSSQQNQGGGKAVDTKYVEDLVLTLEKKFYEIQSADDDDYDNNRLSYAEAVTRWPLSFGALAQGIDLIGKSATTTSTKIIFDSFGFMDRVEKLLNDVSLADLKLYYQFLYVSSFAQYLGDAFSTAYWELFSKALTGASVQPTRVATCTAAQTTFFPDLIGKYYFLKMFDIERTQNVQLMVNAIEQAMGQHIAKLTWLDDATRAEANTKLSKVVNLIGKSTQKKSYAFALSRDNYFTNVQAIKLDGFKNDLAKIGKPVDRSEWGMSAATVNAYYSPSENKMVFPAAILQPPFYAGGVHPVQNFGAVGAVIGHELTHGFDNSGRHYDGDGNQREWWTPEIAKEFEARATCMKKQYSALPAYGDSGNIVGYVNGNTTIGENIADNGGVGLAFDAYHNWLAANPTFNSNGVTPAEAEKLFFLSYGQVWCNKIRDAAQLSLLSSDVHSPKRARVNGVAMNSVEFAKTFNCPVGSKMNPPAEQKCKLW